MKRRAIEFLVLALVVMAAIFSWLAFGPRFRIVELDVDEELLTPSVRRICLETEGVSLFSLSSGLLEKRFRDLCYVDTCKVAYEFPSSLWVDMEFEKEGVVLTDLDRCLFCSPSGLKEMCIEDAFYLKRRYVPLILDKYSFDYISSYGIENGFGSVIALLLEISSLLMYNQKLISFAVYQPGDGNGFGTLTLKMADQDCWIDIKENTDAAYLVTFLGKLQEDAVLPYSLGKRRYEIKDNVLIRREVVV